MLFRSGAGSGQVERLSVPAAQGKQVAVHASHAEDAAVPAPRFQAMPMPMAPPTGGADPGQLLLRLLQNGGSQPAMKIHRVSLPIQAASMRFCEVALTGQVANQ